jgi:hypothetical protein
MANKQTSPPGRVGLLEQRRPFGPLASDVGGVGRRHSRQWAFRPALERVSPLAGRHLARRLTDFSPSECAAYSRRNGQPYRKLLKRRRSLRLPYH